MAKFKVGDKVRVIRKAKHSLSPGKDEFIGKVFTIDHTSQFNDTTYPYYLGGTGYYWCDEELERVFTKADLKDGMVVEDKNGLRGVVIGSAIHHLETHGDLGLYNDDLTAKIIYDCTIDKIYEIDEPNRCLMSYLNRGTGLKLIWERPKEEPVKEMTVAEIEKELGYKVKVVAEE